MRTLVLLSFLALLWSCDNSQRFNFNNKNIDAVRYAYCDASIPPKLQRNYTITVTPDRVEMVVSGGDTIPRDTSVVCSQQAFNKIIDLLNSEKIRNGELSNNDGCTGGDSESLSCFANNSLVFSGDVYYCGGKKSGNLKGDIGRVSEAICNLIPNFESVLRSK
ncbi:MAG: hypothetical protein WCQ95_05810 [Bacteroidota bacterium]